MTKSEDNSKCAYDKVPTTVHVEELEKDSSPKHKYGVRHMQIVIFVMCMTVNFLTRAHLGVTIVAMIDENTAEEVKTLNIENHLEVNENITQLFEGLNIGNDSSDFTNSTDLEVNNTGDEEININRTNDDIWNIYRTYSWAVPYQEMILGAFFLGYCAMMFPIGIVCQRWGGKLPFQISLFINGLVSILTPWLAAWGGWKAVCACRIVQGLAQSGTFPATQALLAKWVPSNELATMTSWVYSGSTLGNVIGFQLAGLLGDSSWGWPSTFWVVGAICIIAGVILTLFGAASPLEHKFISDEEKSYILSKIDGDGFKAERGRLYWKAILRSRHVWATISTHIGSSLAFTFFFTQVPSFIHYTYGTDVIKSGILSSLPYIASFFTSIAFGLISDYCINRNTVTLKTARRLSNSLSQYGVGLSLILASFSTTSALAVTCLVFAMGFHTGIYTGWLVNHIDIASNYTGSIMAFGNTITNVFVLLIPVAVSNIVTDVKNQHQWQILFGMIASAAIVMNTIFVIFISTENQPWNVYEGPGLNETDITAKLGPVPEEETIK